MSQASAETRTANFFRGGVGYDPALLAITFTILAIGIVMVTSAGYMIASGKFNDGFYYTKRQGISMLIGLVLMFVFSRINPRVWRDGAAVVMAIGLFLMVLVFVPGVGVELGGSRRWIRMPVGFFLQPSELIKYALIIFFAHSLAKKGDAVRAFTVGFLPHILIIGVVAMLLLFQPDFGSAVIITTVGFLMMFVAGVKIRHLAGCFMLALPFLIHVGMSAQYRLSRLKSFLDPWSDPLSSGFQIIQSLVAFGCGGVWGAGVGKGIQKLFYLPQPQSDFIFSVIGEELGLLGTLSVVVLFCALIFKGFTISVRSQDPFNKYLAFGITSLIGLQALLNMAVAMGLLPTKGLPLPLISLGGTSMIVNLAGIGILLSVSGAERQEKKDEAPCDC